MTLVKRYAALNYKAWAVQFLGGTRVGLRVSVLKRRRFQTEVILVRIQSSLAVRHSLSSRPALLYASRTNQRFDTLATAAGCSIGGKWPHCSMISRVEPPTRRLNSWIIEAGLWCLDAPR